MLQLEYQVHSFLTTKISELALKTMDSGGRLKISSGEVERKAARTVVKYV